VPTPAAVVTPIIASPLATPVAVSARPTALQLNDYGGNWVIKDIGNGHYAFHAHLRDQSVKVGVGGGSATAKPEI
jgi:hypothetical protein